MSEDTRPDDDSYIVRVKAVVMTRDDSSGGWLAQDGCLSKVGVCRLLASELLGRNSFLIHGERLKDKQVILECFLKKDLVYTKATPTFHHWKVDNRKCGLTFQSPSDARAFDRGVRKALEDLTEGSTTSSSTLQNEAELGDDDVFMTATDSSSSSSQKREPATRTLAPHNFCEARRNHCILGHFYEQHRPSDHHFPDRVSFQVEEEEIVRINPRERSWLTGYEDYRHANSTRDKLAQPDNHNAYIHFAKCEPPKHDYTYPYPLSCDGQRGYDGKPGYDGQLAGSSGRRAVVTVQPRALQPKGKRRKEDGERSRCIYCRDMFNHEDNGRGRCQEAPDPVQTCIRRVSFMWCADSLLYHCMSDPEGDYSDPCSCDASDERFCLRWTALVALSMLAPCMCCYAPLRACYRCGVACRCCGGKHKAVG
ncbi:sprouty-related, EVH1 domain-containing protein 2 isoform X1 [Sander lucioperca]|uniref:sprouty-related, EVH1 domain-containing protein 2 isoform X1 n=1 Tax=Sander lucioperca TaxID=283035 RepID=UPI00125CFB5F|nr:sprouty-related, EVH1 domain-containing protein 2 isoform X1 [Sander lucioperca]XP_035855867.1 sprouty-related, EVH1 domain-containing protein 2 isoform X1 [Sander lucioperca]XP_035855868.1 sprouty-related, EVH1 domain-containing protein 2 isoform X1 [Sander lucioperca]